ncbi:MAG: hypothetical protein LBV72_01275 [Tannerella sp.]|nr:hypothetical protein [Tannerella sp.]
MIIDNGQFKEKEKGESQLMVNGEPLIVENGKLKVENEKDKTTSNQNN